MKENPYGVIAALGSLSSVIAIIVAILFGKIIDKKYGGKMLGASILVRGLINIFRGIFTMNPLTVVVTNILNEISGVAYSLTNQKGAFFEADDSGQRIEYFIVSDMFFFISATAYSVLAFILFSMFGAETGIRIFFAISGIILILFCKLKYSVYEIK